MGLTVNDSITLQNGQELTSYYVGIKDGNIFVKKNNSEFYHIETEFGCYISEDARQNGFEPFKTITSVATSNVAPNSNLYTLAYESFKEGWVKSSTDVL